MPAFLCPSPKASCESLAVRQPVQQPMIINRQLMINHATHRHLRPRAQQPRISVTDRCNLRCTYCMPEEVVFLDKKEVLTFEEIAHFVGVAAPLGIDKVRLTGGEPLMRRGLEKLVELVVAVPGIKDVGLTTNGL